MSEIKQITVTDTNPEQSRKIVNKTYLPAVHKAMKVTPEKTEVFSSRFPTRYDSPELKDLGQSLLANGQLSPVFAHRDKDGLIIIDGHRRVAAAKLVGILELNTVVLDWVPPAAEVHLMQLIFDVHTAAHTAFERADLLKKIKEDKGWSVSELAAQTHMKQPLVSKLLSLAGLSAEVRAVLAGVSQEKCYIIASENDPAKQLELAREAAGLTREQVRRKAHANGQPVELKASTATFAMPSGVVVNVRGTQLSLDGAIKAITEVVKELRQAMKDGLDISTVQRVLRDKAKAHN